MATGRADTSIDVSDSRTVFYQQVAGSLEAVSKVWNINAYALVPVGETEQRLNNTYSGGALDTYGIDFGYSITPDVLASVGYYYQNGDLNVADGSGVRGRLAYNISNGLTLGANITYDNAFWSRFSVDLKYRFGSDAYGAPKKGQARKPSILNMLSASPTNRDVRVHDTDGIIIQSVGGGGDCPSWVSPADCFQYYY
jgi:hypothetical protein